MSANEVLLMKENASGDFEIFKFTAESGKVIGFNSSLQPIMMTAGGSLASFYTQSNLTIDGNNGNFFLIEINANASFSLSNIATGQIYYFRIKNTGASTINITLPNTADIKSLTTVDIGASQYKELAMIYDGTNRTWQISEALT
jgi:hypothetical protein